MQRAGLLALKGLALLLCLPLLYFFAALAGALIPANAGWRQPESGVPIFIRTNGIHTWVMVPKVSEDMDWRPYAPAEHLKDRRYGAGDYVAIGFGNRDFYLNTPTWGDLSVRTAFAAAFGGGPSLVHVDHVWNPRPSEYDRRMVLRPDEYRRLARHLLSSFELTDGRSQPLLGQGYGPSDIFYEARGGYNFVRTCNEWTGDALRTAGVRTGAWTPLEVSVMWRLEQ